MSRIDDAIQSIHEIDAMAAQQKWQNRIHPLAKITVTVFYIFMVVSFPKYDLLGLAGMGMYLLISYITGEVSIKRCIRQLRAVLLIVCAVGIANPFFDRSVMMYVGTFAVTGGMISMVTLILKGTFSVSAAYLLMASTSMEQICYGLRVIHVPKTLVIVLLLTYRYLIVLLKEAKRVTSAYAMRAPGQKGIHWKAWGSLAGQLLLRSIDRAQLVYESMTLRGFDGEFSGTVQVYPLKSSILYCVIWIVILSVFRTVPVFIAAGNLLLNLM